MYDQAHRTYKKLIIGTLAGTVALVGILMAVIPPYSVWSARKTGEAELAQATSNRRIKINEAEALKEAASFQAEAEVVRASGVAKANAIIGESLKGNESYLRYLWIQSLAEKDGRDKEVIYVPTEANLPILEAQRLAIPKAK